MCFFFSHKGNLFPFFSNLKKAKLFSERFALGFGKPDALDSRFSLTWQFLCEVLVFSEVVFCKWKNTLVKWYGCTISDFILFLLYVYYGLEIYLRKSSYSKVIVISGLAQTCLNTQESKILLYEETCGCLMGGGGSGREEFLECLERVGSVPKSSKLFHNNGRSYSRETFHLQYLLELSA